ncbi:hypothetical protein LTR85_008569 [Meristemomyces frigidus]|nr:hypothetical protein LTR85_008569 [Meristemomyces frigidus]
MATHTADDSCDQNDKPASAIWCRFDDRLLGDLQSLTSQHGWLQTDLERLRSRVEGCTGMTSVESALATVQTAVSELKKTLTACETEVTTFWKPTTESAAKAQQVFNIPELVEEILSYLSVREILTAMQTQHAMSSVVKGSTKLLQELSLQTRKSDSLYTPFSEDPFSGVRPSFPWCRFESKYNPGHEWNYSGTSNPTDTVDFVISFAGQRLPRVGSRYRQMLVCQPTVSEMRVSLNCCKYNRDDNWGFPQPASPPYGEPVIPLEVKEGGVTMGHVRDAAAELMRAHRLCPNADYTKLDADGMVNVNPVFYGTIPRKQVEQSAPPERAVNYAWGDPSDAEINAACKEVQLIAYSTAKREAFEAGKPIPTLAEYQATQGTIEAAKEREEGTGSAWSAFARSGSSEDGQGDENVETGDVEGEDVAGEESVAGGWNGAA